MEETRKREERRKAEEERLRKHLGKTGLFWFIFPGR